MLRHTGQYLGELKASDREAASTSCRMSSQTPIVEGARTPFVGRYNEAFGFEDNEFGREMKILKTRRMTDDGDLLKHLLKT